MKKHVIILVTWLLMLACRPGFAQLPPDFPTVTVTTNFAGAVADGYIFEGVNLSAPKVGYYAMIFRNDGTPLWYKALTNSCWDFKVLPNGYLHYAEQLRALSYTGGGDVVHRILDENYSLVESIQAGNGYVAEAHDFKMLPNGNALVVGYYLSEVDMSQVVAGGNPAALVSGAVIQELDAQRNVVFQWRTWDHYPFTSQWVNSTGAVISAFHINCVFEDNDGNLIISTPNWVKKISRQTGDILWHLGGGENQFTFVGVSPEEGVNDFASHDINRLPNGNVLLYHNSAFGQAGTTSMALEYSLDEVNKIATRVWAYVPNPGIAGPFQGSAQRLANGNTFIGWGGLPGVTKVACTEVSGTNVVFQMSFDNTNVVSYRSFRFPYPPQTQDQAVSVTELALGNTYAFGDTGVSLEVQNGAGGYNSLTVTRSPYAPLYPLFQGKAPGVLPVRISLNANGINFLEGNINFDTASFGLSNPTNLTVYYRQNTGQGLFIDQPTSYNPVTHKLSAAVSLASQEGDMGEIIFCYPDLPDIPYPPMLDEVESYRGLQTNDVIAPKLAVGGTTYLVNQELPIFLAWSPKGLSRSYQFQISASPDFAAPLVDIDYQTEADFVWSNASPNTAYYYRVKTMNEGGASDWSTGSFQTVAPFIQLAFPGGGEAWQRGVSYYIRWSDNIAENVSIELYRAGSLVKAIATNAPSSGAYRWQPGFDIAPGSDYSIRIVSATDPSLGSASQAGFSIIDAPVIQPGSVLRLPDGRLQFGVSSPGSPQVTVLGSTNLITWEWVQTLTLNNGSALFTGTVATNQPSVFYRLLVP